MSAIPKMLKISAKNSQEKVPEKSSRRLRVRRLLYFALRPSSLSQKLRQPVSNDTWTAVRHRSLMLWPRPLSGHPARHADLSRGYQSFDRIISKRVTNDLEYLGIVDRAAEFFHPQASGIRNRVFQRIEGGW